ncbi:uncharacterized protein BKA78DRAFT_176518 [Phyllosticta capitalensis]|uniref:uncharacterized protein n=1 Tax=Phyllosticta capitalensis TaxID=121624 RepID=UPI00312D3D1C
MAFEVSRLVGRFVVFAWQPVGWLGGRSFVAPSFSSSISRKSGWTSGSRCPCLFVRLDLAFRNPYSLSCLNRAHHRRIFLLYVSPPTESDFSASPCRLPSDTTAFIPCSNGRSMRCLGKQMHRHTSATFHCRSVSDAVLSCLVLPESLFPRACLIRQGGTRLFCVRLGLGLRLCSV